MKRFLLSAALCLLPLSAGAQGYVKSHFFSADQITTGTLSGLPFGNIVSTGTLDVAKDVRLAHTSGSICFSTGAVPGNCACSFTVGDGTVCVQLATGRVGINKTDPSVALDVNGSALFSAATVAGGLAVNGNTTLGNANSDLLTVNGTAYFVNYVGIGTATPSWPIHVKGTLAVIQAEDTDGAAGIKMYNSNTATTYTNMGLFDFVGKDDGGNVTVYGREIGRSGSSVADGAEEGQIYFQTMKNGALTTHLVIDEEGSTTFIGTAAVQGNAFSVGTSSLVVKEGRVGIGVTAPTTRLQLIKDSVISIQTADASDDGALQIAGAGTTGQTRGAFVQLDGNERGTNPGDFFIVAGDVAGGDIRFNTGNTEDRLIILRDGKVGISSTTPYGLFTVGDGTLTVTAADGDPGRVGIGAKVPGALLQVGETGGDSGVIRLEASDGDEIDFGMSTSDRLDITGGSVQIGDAYIRSAADPLTVFKNASAAVLYVWTNADAQNAFIQISGDEDNYLYLKSGGGTKAGTLLGRNQADHMQVYGSGGNLGVGTNEATDLWFATNDTERMTISSGGNVGIGTTAPGVKLEVNGKIRASTTTWWSEYHIGFTDASPGGSGATLTIPTADTLGGYQFDAANEYIYFIHHLHSDWSAESDAEVELQFEVNIDNTAGNVADTVDISLLSYYKGDAETANKTQTVEVATTVGQSAQYKQFTVSFTLDYNAGGNVIDAGDVISFRVNLETDTSEVDDIVMNHATFKYKTLKVKSEI